MNEVIAVSMYAIGAFGCGLGIFGAAVLFRQHRKYALLCMLGAIIGVALIAQVPLLNLAYVYPSVSWDGGSLHVSVNVYHNPHYPNTTPLGEYITGADWEPYARLIELKELAQQVSAKCPRSDLDKQVQAALKELEKELGVDVEVALAAEFAAFEKREE